MSGVTLEKIVKRYGSTVAVDDISINPKTNYKIGRNDGYSMDIDVAEILAFVYHLKKKQAKKNPAMQFDEKST